MVRAVAEDFARLPDVQVAVLRDRRLEGLSIPGHVIRDVDNSPQQRDAFAELAATSDWTLVIAPEFSHHLLKRCWQVEAIGGRLLGSGPAMVELASDKHRTAEHLAAAGVPVPEGRLVKTGEPLPADFVYPAVLKPCLGAGSQGVRLVPAPEGSVAVGERRDRAAGAEQSDAPVVRLERFCPGQAASVALLCGPAGLFPLVPCTQRLSADGIFAYQGGALPLPAPLAARAVALGLRAAAALPDPRGYLGVDLVLGPDPLGRDDRVIEVNPRLTTSYVGLRVASEANLAAAMLAVCQGRRPELSFRTVRLQFDPDGTVTEALP